MATSRWERQGLSGPRSSAGSTNARRTFPLSQISGLERAPAERYLAPRRNYTQHCVAAVTGLEA
eukprot:5530640-Pyramimonas_sp.AAC.1